MGAIVARPLPDSLSPTYSWAAFAFCADHGSDLAGELDEDGFEFADDQVLDDL